MRHYIKFFYLVLLSLCAVADSNLTDELVQLKNRLQQIETQQQANKGVINLSSAETTMILGGQVTLDTIYLSDAGGQEGGSNSSDQFFSAGNIPLNSEGEKDELTLTARNSKFWVKTRTLSEDNKPFLTLLEIDFWGSNGNEQNSNSHNPRLRHAYFTYNGWTIGQTNSLFVSSIKPSTLMLPVDDIFMRQPIISYETPLLDQKIAFSLEQPESLIMTTAGTKAGINVRVNDDHLPDIGIKYHAYKNRGEYSLSFLGRQISIDRELDQSIKDSVWGYGINLNITLHTFNHDNLTGGVVGGKGVGRYLASGFFPGAAVINGNQLKAQTSWGGHIGYEHWINDDLQLNTALGYVKSDPVLALGTIDQSAHSAHLAIRYSPVKHLLLSSELIYAKRTLQNHESADLNRLYFQASYNF